MQIPQEWFNPVLVWFFVGMVMFLLELVAPGLIVFFFGVGAWIVAVIFYFVPISVNEQLVLFLAASLISLIFIRRWLKETFLGHMKAQQSLQEEMDDITGKKVVVIEDITPQKAGKVELYGTHWTAEAAENISAGTTVEVVSRDSVTLKVKAIRI